VWDAVDAVGAPGRRVYVVAPRASDLLTLLRFWERVEKGEVTVWDEVARRRAGKSPTKPATGRRRHPIVLHGRPDIVGYTRNAASYRWVSVTNWADLGIRDMAKQVGHALPQQADELDKWEANGWPAGEVAKLVMSYTQRLIVWWLDNGCGVWRDTPGAAAWSSFLRRQADTGIVRHEDATLLKLEDRACFGGRASVFFLGDVGDPDRWPELAGAPHPGRIGFGIKGPVHRLDVRSMYPSLLRDEWFPTAPLHYEHAPTLRRLSAGLASLTAVAGVRLCTDQPSLPRRGRLGTEYPVGRFDTVLTTPELRLALSRGWVERCWAVQWYCRGRPFRGWAEWVLNLRTQMRERCDPAGVSAVGWPAAVRGGTISHGSYLRSGGASGGSNPLTLPTLYSTVRSPVMSR
jgi:hypothetical protein